jgi:hypothetical protein
MIKMKSFILNEVDRALVLELLREEQKVRYSKGVQEAYTQQFYAKQASKTYQPVRIEIEIQKFILNKFGFNSDEESLKEYWKIPSTYWHDEEVKNSIFYMKLNIFEYTKVDLNDDLIDVPLIDYKSNNETMLSSLHQEKPLVILAGSMT